MEESDRGITTGTLCQECPPQTPFLCLFVDRAGDMVKEAVMGTATGTLCQECPLSTPCVLASVVVDPQSY